MQGLKNNLNLKPLLERKVSAIGLLTKFQVIYLFEEVADLPKIELAIEGALEFIDKKNVHFEYDNYLLYGTLITDIIGSVVEKAEVSNDGGLILQMSKGVILKIKNNHSQYETLQLKIGDDLIVA